MSAIPLWIAARVIGPPVPCHAGQPHGGKFSWVCTYRHHVISRLNLASVQHGFIYVCNENPAEFV